MVSHKRFREVSVDTKFEDEITGHIMSKNQIINRMNEHFPMPDRINIFLIRDAREQRDRFLKSFREVP